MPPPSHRHGSFLKGSRGIRSWRYALGNHMNYRVFLRYLFRRVIVDYNVSQRFSANRSRAPDANFAPCLCTEAKARRGDRYTSADYAIRSAFWGEFFLIVRRAHQLFDQMVTAWAGPNCEFIPSESAHIEYRTFKTSLGRPVIVIYRFALGLGSKFSYFSYGGRSWSWSLRRYLRGLGSRSTYL